MTDISVGDRRLPKLHHGYALVFTLAQDCDHSAGPLIRNAPHSLPMSSYEAAVDVSGLFLVSSLWRGPK